MAEQRVWLETVIKEFELRQSVTRVISVEEKQLVGTGENYFSQVKKLVARVVRGNGETVTESFVLKQLPPGFHTRQLVLEGGFCFSEFTTYRDVLSSMELLMKEKGITDELIWAKCITMKPYEKIVFEDLTVIHSLNSSSILDQLPTLMSLSFRLNKASGYKMADKFNGLDLEHCTLVVRNLGMFHALGLAMKERGCLPNMVYGEHSNLRTRKAYEGHVETAFRKLLEHIGTWGEEWLPALTKLKSKQPDYVNMIFDFYTVKENEFTVLNHGDAWTNNMLFKYNPYTEKPLFIKFLDFQITFFGTPAHDLTCFLISSPNIDVRLHHKNALVRIYYDSLLLNMGRLGVTEKPPSFEFIEGEMKRLTYMRFHVMTSLLVMIRKKPEDAFNMEDFLKKNDEAAQKGESPSDDQWMAVLDDQLRLIFEITIKEAEAEGTL